MRNKIIYNPKLNKENNVISCLNICDKTYYIIGDSGSVYSGKS